MLFFFSEYNLYLFFVLVIVSKNQSRFPTLLSLISTWRFVGSTLCEIEMSVLYSGAMQFAAEKADKKFPLKE